jgi:cytochrome c oxidase subunit 1
MVDIGTVEVIPPAEVEDVELYHPKSWVTKYVFCQDAKVIAIQYSITAISIGLVALVLSRLSRRNWRSQAVPVGNQNRTY